MYIKPGPNYKMSGKTKRMIALMGGTKESRDQFKRMMIQAELAAALQPKTKKDKSSFGGADASAE